MKKIKIKLCKLAEQDHLRENRLYAHTFHRRDTICVCWDIFRLPSRHFFAILIHELGHLIARRDGDEADANMAALRKLGIMMHYVGKTPYGNRLECISDADVDRARKISFKLFSYS